MSSYRITTDVYVIQNSSDRKILYAPLLNFACEINDDTATLLAGLDNNGDSRFNPQEIAVLEYLVHRGLVNGKKTDKPVQENGSELKPSKLTLFPTNQCNLSCIYCYASHERRRPKTMDWTTATGAIDYYVSLMKKEGRKIFPLELHGGGEPLLPWALVKNLVGYAEDRCDKEGFELQVYAGTNGVLDEKKLEWIIRHFKALTVSFEGLPHVQARQRPMADGSSSFERVNASLKYLDDHQFPYGIRCTVTAYNLMILQETIGFITDHYRTKLIHLEPVSLCRRYGNDLSHLKPDLFQFSDMFIHLDTICSMRGVHLGYSGAQLERLSNTFCYVGTDDFAVTPDGFLTNCWEVTSHEHPLAESFLFGRMLPQGCLQIDKNKIDFLRSLSVDKMNTCQDCFAKWHCSGDCAVKYRSNDFRNIMDNERCRTNRHLLTHYISKLIENEKQYEEIPLQRSK